MVSGGSFLLGGSNKDTRRCFLRCLQASNSSSLLFSIEFWSAVRIVSFSVRHRSPFICMAYNFMALRTKKQHHWPSTLYFTLLFISFRSSSSNFLSTSVIMISQVLTFKLIGHTKSILRTTFFYSFFFDWKIFTLAFLPTHQRKNFQPQYIYLEQ